MSTGRVRAERFEFARGNLQKLLALPKYLLAALLAIFVPRVASSWVFGSGIGFGEGAREVARVLRQDDPEAHVLWLAGNDEELAEARAEGFVALPRRSWAGFWATLRAGQIVMTHGLGDVNRFGVFGGRVVNLIHGAPLKRLHLDAPVTTAIRGPAIARALLRRMYELGTKQIALYVAGSVTAAERLRSAYRVAPGKVQVLGDPRDDEVCKQAADPEAAVAARQEVRALLGLGDEPIGSREPIVLYAPTWRDGAPDPAEPTAEEAQVILAALKQMGVRLLIRSHPLGAGAYESLVGEHANLFGSDIARDITPLLGAFDAIITDYSSIALDFSLLTRPIVWFAPDLEEYSASRGLYEPLEVTAAGRVQRDWSGAIEQLRQVLQPQSIRRRIAEADSKALAARFHAYPEGGAVRRVITAIKRLSLPTAQRFADGGIFFESFYGKQVSCNPLAIDREIARRFSDAPRFWSVTSERTTVPEGATALLVGSQDWFAARKQAQLLVVNDWLRFGFKRQPHQTVLQTWHGTMLKHLALGRPKVSLRARIAIQRESRRWSLMLSQNPHSTEQFRASYAYRGEIIETGYPRDDRLANAVAGDTRIDIVVTGARRALGIAADKRVLAYVPTWRDSGQTVDMLDVRTLANELGDDWVVVARGHTRSSANYLASDACVIDVSNHPDVNDVILAADLLVTDYSSVMFDAAVARVPMLFFVPDLESYRDRERGFTFDFEETAPGDLVSTRRDLVEAALATPRAGSELSTSAYEAWRERFTPHDDGHAAERVVNELVSRVPYMRDLSTVRPAPPTRP